MQTRYTGVRGWTARMTVALAAGAALITFGAGCGGGGNQSGPSITNGQVVTNPSPVSFIGGAADKSGQGTGARGGKTSYGKGGGGAQKHPTAIGRAPSYAHAG